MERYTMLSLSDSTVGVHAQQKCSMRNFLTNAGVSVNREMNDREGGSV
jgi:hypothetical protein